MQSRAKLTGFQLLQRLCHNPSRNFTLFCSKLIRYTSSSKPYREWALNHVYLDLEHGLEANAIYLQALNDMLNQSSSSSIREAVDLGVFVYLAVYFFITNSNLTAFALFRH